MTIEGELVQLDFRNPHSFVHVDVKQKDGTTVRYAVEWGGVGPAWPAGHHARQTFKVGDHVIISGAPGAMLPPTTACAWSTLKRPSDGFSWGQEAGRDGRLNG